jgi:F-type H+-transporting ATPase subunit delta
MSEHGTTARPYAQAVFELASSAGHLREWSAFLQLAAEIVLAPDVVSMVRRPGADTAGLARAMADICRERLGGGPPVAGDLAVSQGANFLALLAANRRLDALPDIAARFEVLRTQAENTVDVTLTSAIPVSEAQQARLVDAISRRFARQVRLTVSVDPGLIGGARLQVGDHIIDGSVRTGLDKLATALRA